MANYTQPDTQVDDTLITTSIWNTQLVENLKALFNPPTKQYKADEGADYQTTSTSFTNVDISPVDSSFSLQLDLDGVADVEVFYMGSIMFPAGSRAYFDFTVDGTRWGGDDGLIQVSSDGTTTIAKPSPLMALVTGLASGTHTINLQWKVGGTNPTGVIPAGAGTLNSDIHPQFWLRKV